MILHAAYTTHEALPHACCPVRASAVRHTSTPDQQSHAKHERVILARSCKCIKFFPCTGVGMEDADSSEDAPRQVDGADGAEHPARSAAAAASGTTGEAAAGAEPAEKGHDAGDEAEGGTDAGSTQGPKDPIVENLERLLQ